jgi:hypothetical protein
MHAEHLTDLINLLPEPRCVAAVAHALGALARCLRELEIYYKAAQGRTLQPRLPLLTAGMPWVFWEVAPELPAGLPGCAPVGHGIGPLTSHAWTM